MAEHDVAVEVAAEGPQCAPARIALVPQAAAVLRLQRQVGNRATTQMLQRVGADGTITDATEMERYRPVGGTVDNTTRTRIFDTLRRAPRSRATLDDIQRMRGNLDFAMKWSNRGTYHSTGEVWLERNLNDSAWIAGLAHELVHLQTFLAGRAANIATMTRADFVAAKMSDEINAHAASYVALLQLGRASAQAMGYSDFQRDLARTNPDAIRTGDWAAVESAARTWLESRYRTDAAWRTSNTNENYHDYWGGAWDSAHPRPRSP